MLNKSLALMLAVLLAGLIAQAAASTVAPKTLDNLQTAFNGESNAQARYLEFAKQAEAEGYGPVASLFRAAARAEQVHAANHARVIKKLGGEPQANIARAEVKSTAENLQAAIQGETYERDTMYPEFLKEALRAGNSDAVVTFTLAKTAEAEHARLYSEALQQLTTLRGAAETYYVCTICGYTTKKVDFEKCPSCLNPKDRYVPVA